MRPGQKNRSRGRNGGGGGLHHNRPRLPHRVQTFDSNGPSVKIRGNAYQVYERYQALAREAQTSGDRVAAENLYQHAEHYYRIMSAMGENQGQGGQPRPPMPGEFDANGPGEGEGREGEPGQVQMHAPMPQPPGDPEFRRELDEANRPTEHRDDEPPGF